MFKKNKQCSSWNHKHQNNCMQNIIQLYLGQKQTVHWPAKDLEPIVHHLLHPYLAVAFNLLPPHHFSNRIPIPFFNKLRSTNNTHTLVQLTILHSYSDPNALSTHKHHSPQTRYRKNQITSISFLLLFNSNTMSIHFKHTSSQSFSIPTNSSKQYHNQQNHQSIQFNSIRFDSIRFNSIPTSQIHSAFTQLNLLKSAYHKHHFSTFTQPRQ